MVVVLGFLNVKVRKSHNCIFEILGFSSVMWLCPCGFTIRGDAGRAVDVSWITSDPHMTSATGLIAVAVVLM